MSEKKSLEQLRKEIQATDKEMAALFERRMHLVEGVIRWKMEKSLPILDEEREEMLLHADLANISDPALKEYYELFLRHLMDLSKSYQKRLMKQLK